jgi:glycosyltransferase involved in cell wall biosynthesis
MSSADPGYCFFSGGAEEAIRADAWFGLLDRFPLPLLPLRPYGVLIYDMLQRHLPEIFGPPDCDFFRWYKGGMIPTAKSARFVAVTTPQTQRDVIEEYGLRKRRVRLLPLGSDPGRRFAAVDPKPMAVPREPYILKVANAANHKGAGVLLQAYAKLKQIGHQNLLPIVCCGAETDRLSSDFRGEIDHPNGPRIRALVPALGLKEGIDVVFLGFVTESQLKYLYERSSVVVNAGKWDNGSYSLIEATYFGKPVICSRYPAAEFICQRFGVQAKFFPIDDSDALAELLRQSLAQEAKSISREEITDIRRKLADTELSTRRYAERIYDCLVELAEEGRRLRLSEPARSKSA